VLAERVYFHDGSRWNQSGDGGANWQEKAFPEELALDAQEPNRLYGVYISWIDEGVGDGDIAGRRSENGGES
jgi:hypothetical protein